MTAEEFHWYSAGMVERFFSGYHRTETLEINLVPSAVQDNVLGETVCQALSLTGINVFPDELHSCHWLKKKIK